MQTKKKSKRSAKNCPAENNAGDRAVGPAGVVQLTNLIAVLYGLLDLVVQHLPSNDKLFFALVCKAFRDDIFKTHGRCIVEKLRLGKENHLRRFSTDASAIFSTKARMLWGMQRAGFRPNFLEECFNFDGREFFLKRGRNTKRTIQIMAEKGAKYGSIPTIDLAYKEPGAYQFFRRHYDIIINIAASAGKTEVIKWFYKLNMEFSAISMAKAAKAGHLDALIYMCEQDDRWEGEPEIEMDCRTPKAAAEMGFLNIIEYIFVHDENLMRSEETWMTALQFGHLHILKFLNEHYRDEYYAPSARSLEEPLVPGQIGPKDETCHIAAAHGFLHIVKWVVLEAKFFNGTQKDQWDHQTTEEAAAYNEKDVLEWAVRNGCDFYPARCRVRAEINGHIEAQGGDFSVIAWLDYIRDEFCGGNETMHLFELPLNF